MKDKSVSVLVVDDDVGMRLGMARALEREGLHVRRCANGRQALEALSESNWDAMVTDVRMPGMSGRELMSKALAIRPDLCTILVTGFGTVENAVEAIRKGASDYLLKPFSPRALVAAVERAVAKKGDVPTSVDKAGQPSQAVGRHPAFIDLLDRAARAAQTDATVLITGESGTGKEVVARYIHDSSSRKSGPFVAVNCAALPAELLEAELFGVQRGAFTGAERDREGYMQRANGGTLLLDEIGDCPKSIQAKLLRVLEERVVVPLGSGEPVPLDIRIIAATHHQLFDAVAEGRFRQDLYFRLRVVPLQVPPLRQRLEDIPLLTRHLTAQIAGRVGRKPPRITQPALTRLRKHHWPGNVRELRNVLERAVVFDRTGVISPSDLFLESEQEVQLARQKLQPGMTIAQVERQLIETTLEAAGGNRTRASEMLGISVRTLRNKLKLFREQPAQQIQGAP